VLFADPSGALDALRAAVRLRRQARHFYASILIPDQRAATAALLAPRLLAQFATYDERRAALDALATGNITVNGRPQAEFGSLDGRILKTLADLAALSDGLLCRSQAEAQNLRRLLGRHPRRSRFAVNADAAVPQAARSRRGESIVVWAPSAHAESVAIQAFALEELRVPRTVVCREGQIPGVSVAYCPASQGATALSEASVVIDAELTDPGTALSLARWGKPLVVSSSSGAADWLDGVAVYDAWDRASVLQATVAALGYPPPVPLPIPSPELTIPARTPRRDVAAAPLVSVIIPTYNRRDLLPATLESVQNQTYPNLEILVINDAGPDVSDIVARFPRARLLNMERNGGAARALNAGIRDARGTYVSFLGDDDVYFPEHIEDLVDALERSGATVAHAGTLTRFLEPDPSGGYREYGYVVEMNRGLDLSQFLVHNYIGSLSLMIRREALLQDGFDESLGFCVDYELLMRLAHRYDFVHVDRISSLYSRRNDKTNLTYVKKGPDYARVHRAIFDRFPAHGRPAVAALRDRVIAEFLTMNELPMTEPPLRIP